MMEHIFCCLFQTKIQDLNITTLTIIAMPIVYRYTRRCVVTCKIYFLTNLQDIIVEKYN
jgi:hypothetical protein